MVYRGKPSKACSHCRRRRLLCDLNRDDGCAQCRRANLACGGWRDTNALRINDETVTVRNKVLATSQTKLPKSVDVPVRLQAKDMFYYNYVVGAKQTLNFLEPFYGSTSDNVEHLLNSIDAVSLAYLNFQKRTALAEKEARRHYVTALRLIGTALQDPTTAREDSTILSVLLLDTYEKLVNNSLGLDAASAAHMNGAFALVKLRGDGQYRDPTGLGILIRLTTNMVIHCVAGNRMIPPDLVSLRRAIAAHFPQPETPKWRETDLMLEYLELRRRIQQGHLSDLEVMRAAKDLDAQFCAFAKNIEAAWHYETLYTQERSQHHFDAVHHWYKTPESVQMWNLLRLARILVNETIWSHAQASSCGERDVARQVVDTVAREICATVPQFIHGSLLPPDCSKVPEHEPKVKSVNSGQLRPHLTHQLPCYRLIYPLYIAAQCPVTSPDIRSWIVRQLEFMADFHAMENAAKVANILESGEPLDPWLVYALLGSYAFA